jgi:hypothetical protein
VARHDDTGDLGAFLLRLNDLVSELATAFVHGAGSSKGQVFDAAAIPTAFVPTATDGYGVAAHRPGRAEAGRTRKATTMNGLELFLNRRFGRAIAVVATVTLVAAVFVLVGGARVEARVVVHTRAGEVSAPVQGAAVLELPFTC